MIAKKWAVLLLSGALGTACGEVAGLGSAPQTRDVRADDASAANGDASFFGDEADTERGDAEGGGELSGGEGSISSGDFGPNTMAPASLRLWLTADHGTTCISNRLTRWSDQSGNRDDATPQLGELGPQCDVAGPLHVANGVNLPYFSAPVDGTVIDETLDVNLSFLQNSNYTVFVVERRWQDRAYLSGMQELVLGTSAPSAYQANPGCAVTPAFTSLSVGYVYYFGPPSFSISHFCSPPVMADVVPVTDSPPAALTEETARFQIGGELDLWMSGRLAASVVVQPLASAAGGAIGRAMVDSNADMFDTRFRGDIAEIVVYDTALSPADRLAVEQYLRGHWQLGAP